MNRLRVKKERYFSLLSAAALGREWSLADVRFWPFSARGERQKTTLNGHHPKTLLVKSEAHNRWRFP
jgi:hypothetical protein